MINLYNEFLMHGKTNCKAKNMEKKFCDHPDEIEVNEISEITLKHPFYL